MDKDLIRLKRRQSFVARRTRIWKEIMENHPKGVTKENLQQIKDEMKKEKKGGLNDKRNKRTLDKPPV